MAFTAYIFQEDFIRLTTREVIHTSQSQKGGSLFGQWTSTGNPVIHFAVSYSASDLDRHKMGKDLYDCFRICYIGEWRPVATRQVGDEMKARWELRRADAPARFLVLDVSRADITPFLFESQVPKGKGTLEKLSGKNPFNKTGLFERQEPTRNYNPQRHTDQSAAAAQSWAPARPLPQVQPQEANTRSLQWYSSDEGNEKLKKVLENFREIALYGKVDMSRDTTSQDISLSFTDNRYRRMWEVKFPAMFPNIGALLIENPGMSTQRSQRQASSDKASKAVKNIISCIQKPY